MSPPGALHDDIGKMLSVSGYGNMNKNAMCPPLKSNKDSHMINKKSFSTMMRKPPKQPQQRNPVIIYTEAPRIIHTSPADFMALVQNLTGLPKQDNNIPPQDKPEPGISEEQERKSTKTGSRKGSNGDSETSSVSSDGNSNLSMRNVTVNAPFAPPMFEPQPLANPHTTNFSLVNQNPASYYVSDQSISDYTDPLFFSPDMSSLSTTMEDFFQLS